MDQIYISVARPEKICYIDCDKNRMERVVEMKKLSRLLLVFFLGLFLASCGNGASQESTKLESVTGGESSAASIAEQAGDEDTVSSEDIGNEDGNALPGETLTESEPEAVDEASVSVPEESPADKEASLENDGSEEDMLPEDGTYTTKEDVALYIYLYGKLPSNFITKKEAEKLGWEGGSLEPYAPGKCIGGSHFGNYEGLLPEAEGRVYTECDIDTLGAQKRGAKRIVFSNDGLIYYTEDHYESFELLYGEE